MESENQTVNDKVLLCEPLDQGLQDGQLVPNAGGHDGTSHRGSPGDTDQSSILNRTDQTDSGSPNAPLVCQQL